MKKSGLFVILACVVFLIWTMSCQSPSSTDNPSSSARVEDNQTNSSNNSGSSDSGAKTNMGFLRLILKDAPIEGAQNIFVKIREIRVHKVGEEGESGFKSVWYKEDGEEIDLLPLEKAPLAFPPAPIDPGTYNQIRLTIIDGRIVFNESEGSCQEPKGCPLIVPSDEIKINYHFVLEPDQTISITVDFEAKNSIHIIKKGNQTNYKLRPVIHVVEAVPEPST